MECPACKFEAEYGTPEVPHPVDPRVHECLIQAGLVNPEGTLTHAHQQHCDTCGRETDHYEVIAVKWYQVLKSYGRMIDGHRACVECGTIAPNPIVPDEKGRVLY